MSYTSFIYLLLVGGTVLLYYLLPLRFRWLALLAGNLVFYAQAGMKEMACMLAAVLCSWAAAIRLEEYGKRIRELRQAAGEAERRERDALTSRKRRLLQLALLAVLGILAVTKYTNFILETGARVLHRDAPVIRLVLPLGISFYTFQMVAYLMDVYKGKTGAQRNVLKYLLYASFFPTVVQGPIARYKQLGEQLFRGNRLRFENLRDGGVLLLWGFAKKLIMAERLGVFVSTIFDNYRDYHGLILLLAAAVYSVQIYADFSGCMDIAAGTAQMFGVEIAPNFLRPYFSRNMPEFWRRWHASLGSWFRDYVFFPFSISRLSQKLNRGARARLGDGAGRIVSASLPILLVWILTGIWHGAATKYVVWGLFHGTLIMMSTIFGPALQKVNERLPFSAESRGFQVFRMLRTFFLCCIGRVFFRAGSVSAGFRILRSMVRGAGLSFVTGSRITEYGLNGKNIAVVVIFFLLWFTVSVLQEKNICVREKIGGLPVPVRWCVYYGLMAAVLVFGKYGPSYEISDFIYEQF